MTVSKLIENLSKIEDKDMRVITYIDTTEKFGSVDRVEIEEFDCDTYIERMILIGGNPYYND